MMKIPGITNSTREERLAFVQEQWQCLNHCPSCGKCRVLKGADAENLYAEYIEGRREYMDITKEIRQR